MENTHWTNRSLCWNQKGVQSYITLPSSGHWNTYSRSFPLVIFEAPVDVIKLPLWKWIPLDAGRGLWWAARNTTMLTAKRWKLGSSGFFPYEHYSSPSHLRRRRRGGSEHKPIFRNQKEKVAKMKHLFLCRSHRTQLERHFLSTDQNVNRQSSTEGTDSPWRLKEKAGGLDCSARLASGKSLELFGPATTIMKDLNCQPSGSPSCAAKVPWPPVLDSQNKQCNLSAIVKVQWEAPRVLPSNFLN